MAEVILRLSSSLVGWLLIFSHGLLLAVVPRADCSVALWRTSLLFACLAMLGALLLPAALDWRESLRWLGIVAAPLWAYGLYVSLWLLASVTIGGTPFCEALEVASKVGGGAPGATPGVESVWERAWAPTQLVAIALGVWQAARYWRARL